MNSDHHDKHAYCCLKYFNILLAAITIGLGLYGIFITRVGVYMLLSFALFNSWAVFNIVFHCVSHHTQIKLLKWRGLIVYFLFAIYACG